ncbi:MAG: HAMP domain-containing histidine kinase [Candidatus Izimaplasma sp.]|nr:HAMP domain-containing histidine kinase [Candidatus Izimaplasma bacterium]
MSKPIKTYFRRSIIILTIITTVIFLVINVALYLINNNYLTQKIKEENNAFLDITTHLVNYNDIDTALEYVEHYTHIHAVEIEVIDAEGNMLYSSDISHRYTYQYQIDTNKGDLTIFIDNIESVTVTTVEDYWLYINISLLIIYIITIVFFIWSYKQNTKSIDDDLSQILALINKDDLTKKQFNYQEFKHINNEIKTYLENIDLLTEQKNINMKGIAHDIKTPLTIIYNYFNAINNDEKLSKQRTKSALKSAQKVNELVSDLIKDNYQLSHHEINISKLLDEKIESFKSVLTHKNITIDKNIQVNVMINWNTRDFSRIIDNLMSNGFYYSKPDTKFKISLTQDKHITLMFESVPTHKVDDLNNVFEKGVRGQEQDDSNDHKGYGLYICRLLLKPINGKITAEYKNNTIVFKIII